MSRSRRKLAPYRIGFSKALQDIFFRGAVRLSRFVSEYPFEPDVVEVLE